ncbi:MAG: hypothetical protein ACLTWK_12250 [Eisenbergiella sp.]
MKNRGIGESLKRARSYQKQAEILFDWVINWKSDQQKVIHELRVAAQRDDHGTIMHKIQQLEGMTEKRFTALGNVVKTVSNPDRVLKDERDKEENEDIESKATSIIPSSDEELKNSIIKEFQKGYSIKDISITVGISEGKVIKILVTENLYSSPLCEKIKSLRQSGKNDDEIKKICRISDSCLSVYTPYKKGMYTQTNRNGK